MNKQSEGNPNPGTRLMPLVLRRNPGLGFTVVYLGVSLIGLLFSYALFSRFDVNIFDFTEVSDFLLAALREPMTFVMTIGAVIVASGLLWLARVEARFFQARPPKSRIMRGYARLSALNRHPGTIAFVFVAYCYLFISLYGHWKADRIKAGSGKRISIQLGEPPATGGTGNIVSGILLGSTNKYLFIYDPATRITSAMPTESIVQVIISAPAETGNKPQDRKKP